MSQALLILFYISLGILVIVIGRGILFPYTGALSKRGSIFEIPVLAQGVRNLIMWVPQILRATLVNIAGGISMAIHVVASKLEAYRHRHEEK